MEFINNSQDNFHQERVELIKISMTQIVQRFFLSFLFFGGVFWGGGGRVYNFTMLKIKDFPSHSRKFLKFHTTISKLNHILT